MTTTDYLLNFLLIGLVVLQIRGRRLSPVTLLLPVGIVAWAATSYLRSFPTAGNDLVLELGCAAVGALLGIGCAVWSRIERDDSGSIVVKAGVVAAALWVAGVGSRLAFQMYATHGGGESIGRFSMAHQITTSQAWVTALILMAFGEVLFRTAGIWIRALRTGRGTSPAMRPAFSAGTAPTR
ncbi:MAG: hypothetical protein ABSE47_01810 [Acidimicrobiales bacterium]|jgi:hypothetical protein